MQAGERQQHGATPALPAAHQYPAPRAEPTARPQGAPSRPYPLLRRRRLSSPCVKTPPQSRAPPLGVYVLKPRPGAQV